MNFVLCSRKLSLKLCTKVEKIEIRGISIMANFSQKLEDNKITNNMNYLLKIRSDLPHTANCSSKICGVETIGVAKMRQNISKMSFRANFPQKARKFVCITFA